MFLFLAKICISYLPVSRWHHSDLCSLADRGALVVPGAPVRLARPAERHRVTTRHGGGGLVTLAMPAQQLETTT